MLKFIEGKPAAVFDNFIVIAETHINYEEELRKKGIHTKQITENLIEAILEIKNETGKKNLMILGDVKHNITFLDEETIRFILELEKHFNKIYIIKGNHDGNIEELKSKKVKIFEELHLKNTLFIHGHKYPKKLEKLILMAHIHPQIKIGKEKFRCWIIGDYLDSKVIIFPAFNPLLGGTEEFGNRGIYKELKNVIYMDLNLRIIKSLPMP